MTDTLAEHADQTLHKGEPLIQMIDIGKTYGAIRALKGINLRVNAGEVTCVLGDNGRRQVDADQDHVGVAFAFRGQPEGRRPGPEIQLPARVPRSRHRHGVPGPRGGGLMEVWRNFFLGSELRAGN